MAVRDALSAPLSFLNAPGAVDFSVLFSGATFQVHGWILPERSVKK